MFQPHTSKTIEILKVPIQNNNDGPRVKLAPKYVLPCYSKDKVGKKNPTFPLITDNFETSLAIIVGKNLKNRSGSIVDRLI